MKQLALFITICFFTITVFSQEAVVKDLGDFYQALRAYSYKDAVQTINRKDINGSPYLNDEFLEGEITTSSGIKYLGLLLRYNIYNDKIEYKGPEDKTMQVSVPEVLKEVKIGNDIFIFTAFLQNKTVKKGYFQCLTNGTIKLLKRFQIRYEQPGELEAYKEQQLAKFSKKPVEFYIQNGLTSAILVNSSKTLLSVLNDKHSEIESYIKTHKLNLKKEEDLRNIIEYYSSIK